MTLRFCSQMIAGDEPPRAFLIFRRGVNDSSHGEAIYDASAVELVRATYEREGVDIMIDLEHDALSEAARVHRNDAGDAMGWCKLDFRADGSLWAVDVRWTSEGEARLRAKKQRYVSPAFGLDDDQRVTRLVNVAITSLPATYDAEPLVAATRDLVTIRKGSQMTPDQVTKALDIIKSGDSEAALALLSDLIATSAGGGEPPAEDAPPEALASEGAAPPAPAPAADPELRACARVLHSFTGRRSSAEAERELVAMRSRLAEYEADARVRDSAARAELVGDLVRFGAELPATAWANAETRTPCERLANESLVSLRSRVDAFRNVREGQQQIAPPASSGRELSAIEQRHAPQDPAHRAAYEARRALRRIG